MKRKIDDKMLSSVINKLKKEQHITLSEVTLNRTVSSQLSSELFLLFCSEIHVISLLSQNYFFTWLKVFLLTLKLLSWVKMNIFNSGFNAKFRVVC